MSHADARAGRRAGRDRGPWCSARLTDDGRGFDTGAVATASDSGHLGIAALRGLVTDAGGTLTLAGTPGEGTMLRVEVPL